MGRDLPFRRGPESASHFIRPVKSTYELCLRQAPRAHRRPSVMMFFAMQRHFVAGLTFGATKGQGDKLFVQQRVDLGHDVVRYELLQVSRRMIRVGEHVDVVSIGGDIRRA